MESRRLKIIADHFPSLPASAPTDLRELPQLKEGIPVIIGAMVLDIHATPYADNDLRRATTAPGQILYHRGGVGRNVAECMRRLNSEPFFISVVGQDMAGDELVAHWESLGLPVDGICRLAEASTPVVSAIFDKQGEVAAAVADVQTIEKHLTAKWIQRFADKIRSAAILMLDANLLPESLEVSCKLAHDANVPVWFEPVSVSKAVRAVNVLKYITYISPNEAELVSMAAAITTADQGNGGGHPSEVISSKALNNNVVEVEGILRQLRTSIKSVLTAGVHYVILTLGHHGAALCSSSIQHSADNQMLRGRDIPLVCKHYPALPASVVTLSGAGDCLVAGALSVLAKSPACVEEALCYGMAAAKAAVESKLNVPTQFQLATMIANSSSCKQSGQLLLVREMDIKGISSVN